LKVAHITSVHSNNDNRIFYKEVTTLSNSGYDVVMIVAGSENKKVKNIDIVGYPKAQSRIKRLFKTSLFDMIKICSKINADIYHFHDPELIFVGLYLKIKGKKVIYDIHENNPASILSKPYLRSKYIKKLLSVSFDIFERTIVKFFDALVTARPDITKRFNHDSIITLRNFPILPDFGRLKKIDIKKTKPSVIFVGGMTEIRGINQLIDAFEDLDAFELWLLGPITEKKLKDRILSGCKNVKYFGIVEAYDVFSYINKADIGIITFLPVPNHLTTLATKPFEYMACGKAMIMSDFDYWQETFGKSSLYVNPLNPKEIAKTISSLLNDKKLLKDMGELNKKLSLEEYNWQKESQKLINLYKKLEK